MVESLIDNRPLNNKTWFNVNRCSVIGQWSWRRSPAEEDWQVVYIHILHCTSSSDGHVSSHSSGQYGTSLKSEHTLSTVCISGSHFLSVSFFNAQKLKGCSSCGLVIGLHAQTNDVASWNLHFLISFSLFCLHYFCFNLSISKKWQIHCFELPVFNDLLKHPHYIFAMLM